jgi:hypothetical protein
MEKMSLTIMFHRWEVKPFFAKSKPRTREQKYSDPSAFPYTGDSMSAHWKCFTTWMLKEASHATRPLCSFGEEIFCLLSVEGFWNVVHLIINKGTSPSLLRQVLAVKPYESETPC